MAKKKKKVRQYRSNQGRSPEKMEKIYKGCFWIIVIALSCVASAGIYNLLSL
jgi:hypothetical protein|tara:strand:+ start:407 stop:562 length:156 start_codon:yes stop_codon:yes gene_type:complete